MCVMTFAADTDQAIENYARSHRNPFNRALHALCAPLFLCGLIGLCWTAPEPVWLARLGWLNWGGIALAGLLGCYLRMSRRCLIAGTSFSLLCAVGWHLATQLFVPPLWPVAALMLGVSAALQMAGALLEPKSTERRLLSAIVIGPLWGLEQLLHKCSSPSGVRREH